MAPCSLYVVGVALVVAAIGYQFRDDLSRLMVGRMKGAAEPSSRGPGRASEMRPLAVKPRELSEYEKETPQWKKAPLESESDTQYYNPPFDPQNYEKLYSESGTRLITLNELAAHSHSGPLEPVWLAILGRVYDVSKGLQYYGPDGGYNFFTGIDGTRAFVTGEFNDEGLSSSVEGLTPLEVGEIDRWTKFYDKDYTYVGKLIGRYYSKDGSPTKHWYAYRKAVGEEEKIKALQKEQEMQFPSCNSRWTQTEGGSVSCSDKSGGIHRNWVGVPRRYSPPGSRSWRCACVKEEDLNSPHIKHYPDCDPTSISCKVNKEKLAQLRARE